MSRVGVYPVLRFGIWDDWYDGPMAALWLGPFTLDLTRTRLGDWLWSLKNPKGLETK